MDPRHRERRCDQASRSLPPSDPASGTWRCSPREFPRTVWSKEHRPSSGRRRIDTVPRSRGPLHTQRAALAGLCCRPAPIRPDGSRSRPPMQAARPARTSTPPGAASSSATTGRLRWRRAAGRLCPPACRWSHTPRRPADHQKSRTAPRYDEPKNAGDDHQHTQACREAETGNEKEGSDKEDQDPDHRAALNAQALCQPEPGQQEPHRDERQQVLPTPSGRPHEQTERGQQRRHDGEDRQCPAGDAFAPAPRFRPGGSNGGPTVGAWQRVCIAPHPSCRPSKTRGISRVSGPKPLNAPARPHWSDVREGIRPLASARRAGGASSRPGTRGSKPGPRR